MINTIKAASANHQTIAELHYKKSCKFATAAEDLTSGYAEDHDALTITKLANGVVTIDGGTLVLDDHILVKDQTDTKENGIYKVTQLGSGSAPLILTREDHFNSPKECESGKVYFVIVSSGSTNAHKSAFIGVGTESTTTTFGTTTFSVTASGAASEITVADESTDTTCFPVFTTDATGNRAPKTGTNLRFNSSSGLLTATKFSGELSMDDAGAGTLSTARGGTGTTNGTSTLIKVTDSTANLHFPVVFHDNVIGGDHALLDDTGSFTYNPSSGLLTATGFAGPLTGNVTGNTSGSSGSCTGNSSTATTATTATNVTVTNEDSDNTCFPLFVTAAATNGGAKTSANFKLDPNIGSGAVSLKLGDATHGSNLIVTGGTTAFISCTGDITAFASDKRLKTDIEIISNPLDKINKITGFTYCWDKEVCDKIQLNTDDNRHIGVYAQDIQAVLPEAVKPAPFDTDSKGNSKSGDNYLTVQYEKIVPLLIECIKEQQTQIEELRNEIDSLKK